MHFTGLGVTVQTPIVTQDPMVATLVDTIFAAFDTLVAIAPPRANKNAKVDKITLVIFMIDKCLEFYNK